MKRLVIVRPYPVAAIYGTAGYGFTNAANLLTPNPKEIAATNALPAGQTGGCCIDLGAVVSVDTLLLGFTSAPAGTTITLLTDNAAFSAPAGQGTQPVLESALVSPVRHGFVRLAAPVASRYWRFHVTNNTGADLTATIGVLALGLAFEASWGHEYGAGRPVEDTSTVERLMGGTFGIDEGVILGGYQWTFGDLQPAEVEALYALVRALGISRSVLVVEDPDQTAGLAERIHWSLFDRLEPYERLNPLDTRWAFKVRDWG